MAPSDIHHTIRMIQEEPDHFRKARLIASLREGNTYRITEIASFLKIKPASVCHLLRLNKLPSIVVDAYYGNLISITHLYVIARLPNQQMMIQLFEQVLAENLTSQQTDEALRQMLYAFEDRGHYISKKEMQEFERDMKQKNKRLYPKIIQGRTRGKLILEVHGNLEHTTRVLHQAMEALQEI